MFIDHNYIQLGRQCLKEVPLIIIHNFFLYNLCMQRSWEYYNEKLSEIDCKWSQTEWKPMSLSGPYAGFFCQGGSRRAEGPYIFKYEATFILPYIFKVK